MSLQPYASPRRTTPRKSSAAQTHSAFAFSAPIKGVDISQPLPGGIKDLPKVITDEIALNYPTYTAPPPADDKRPNETSWSYFKKRVDAKKAAAAK